MGSKALIDLVEILVDPTPAVLQQSTIAPGMGILYRYHPDSGQRLAEGFPRFAEIGEGRLVLARSTEGLIVGYALIAKPDPRERWREPGAPEIWELGIIEVARGWRQRGIGRKLLRACFADGAFDDRIVLATAYAWHWDLQGTGLSKAAYREVLLRFFGSEGFQPLETDEPNIREDPANRLLARIGPRVDRQVLRQFLALLQAGQGVAPQPAESLSPPWKSLTELLAGSLQMWSPIWWLFSWSEIYQAAVCQTAKSMVWWLSLFEHSKPLGTAGTTRE